MNIEELKAQLASVEEDGEAALNEAKAISEEEAAAFDERMRHLEEEAAARFERARAEADTAQQVASASREREAAAEEAFAARCLEERRTEHMSEQMELARRFQSLMQQRFQLEKVIFASACTSQVKWARDQRDKHVLEAQKAALVAEMQADALRRLADSEERHYEEKKKLYDSRLTEAVHNVNEQVRLMNRGVSREQAAARRLQRIEEESCSIMISQLQTTKEEAYTNLRASEVQEAEAQKWSTEMPIAELTGFWPHHGAISDDD